MEEPAPPRLPRGAHLDALGREDLDVYGVVELRTRITELEAEIERTQGVLARKTSGRQAADALFSFGKG